MPIIIIVIIIVFMLEHVKMFSPKLPDHPWGPTPASSSVGTGFLSQRYSGRGVKVTTLRLLATRIRLELCLYPPLPHTCKLFFKKKIRLGLKCISWRGQGRLHIFLISLDLFILPLKFRFQRTSPHLPGFSRTSFPKFM